VVNSATISDLQTALLAQAKALGFAACGIASAAPDEARAERLEQWVAAGHHGDMGWMAERLHHRRSPQDLGLRRNR